MYFLSCLIVHARICAQNGLTRNLPPPTIQYAYPVWSDASGQNQSLMTAPPGLCQPAVSPAAADVADTDPEGLVWSSTHQLVILSVVVGRTLCHVGKAATAGGP